MSCSNCPAMALLNNTTPNPDENCGKLKTYDWLKNIPDTGSHSNIVEIRFKNTHKEFYVNRNNIRIKTGDYVAVEAERGHDIGQVTLMGRLAVMQHKRKNPRNKPGKIIYRKANTTDIQKWHFARLKEKSVMVRARQIAANLKLEMKVSDVGFQGDGSKAIFYYIAEGRVDFRELIKKYASEFNVRIEMRQIGARQEAAMVGGIGSCGKELCCSAWRNNLETVLTASVRIQELPPNAQKLTGQCGKLKCCLMYELDSYIEAQSDFPDLLLELETEKGIAFPKKKDILRKIIYYGFSKEDTTHLLAVPLDRVKQIIMLNKKGIKPRLIEDVANENQHKFVSFESDLQLTNKKVHPKRIHKKGKSKI